MIGALVGDIVGSRFEWHNIKKKEFDLFSEDCFFTDDSVMTLAIAKALMASKAPDDLGRLAVASMRELGRHYPRCGYGNKFFSWFHSDTMGAYQSYGNGSAMRVSACGWAAKTLDEAIALSRQVTVVTHDHPDGIKGAEATVVCLFLARSGMRSDAIRSHIDAHYYPMDFTLDGIRAAYRFNETCQDTVPQAIMAYLESVSFEDAIRNAVSIGGDSDTLAAITGSIAEACYGVPPDIRETARSFLDQRLLGILTDFETRFPMEVTL